MKETISPNMKDDMGIRREGGGSGRNEEADHQIAPNETGSLYRFYTSEIERQKMTDLNSTEIASAAR